MCVQHVHKKPCYAGVGLVTGKPSPAQKYLPITLKPNISVRFGVHYLKFEPLLRQWCGFFQPLLLLCCLKLWYDLVCHRFAATLWLLFPTILSLLLNYSYFLSFLFCWFPIATMALRRRARMVKLQFLLTDRPLWWWHFFTLMNHTDGDFSTHLWIITVVSH